MTVKIPNPVDTLIHIGANNGNCNDYYQHAQRLLLIEPNPKHAPLLNNICQDHGNACLFEIAIAKHNGHSAFNIYNWNDASSLYQATGLAELMPGLKVQQVLEVATLTLYSLLDNAKLSQHGNHLLIIDACGAEQLIAEQLAQLSRENPFSHIILHCPHEPLYSSNSCSETVLKILLQLGYELVATDSSDPDRPFFHLHRNTLKLELFETRITLANVQKARDDLQKKLTEQSAQLSATKNKLSELALELELAKKAHSKAHKALANDKTCLEQQQAQLQQQLAEALQSCSQLEQQLAEISQAKEKAQQQVEMVVSERDNAKKEILLLSDKLEEKNRQLKTKEEELKNLEGVKTIEETLEEKIKEMFSGQTQEINKAFNGLKNHINNGLGNTAKQIESFMGIQSYLEKGVKPLSYHGWPISPDIGLYITGLIDETSYDCIIEFGSGTSTLLMAKALKAKQKKLAIRNIKAIDKIENSKEIKKLGKITSFENNYHDFPANIVSFEHNSLYFEKTKKLLSEHEVEHLVDLIHAPLVDYQYKDGQQYLYYNCREKLEDIAKLFKGRKANILVLVDGPPGATNKNARFPALPHLINTLAGHKLTLIMDDYNRAEEKEIMVIWKKILTDRGINISFDVIPSEKGLSVLTTH
ncbi:FkbM family methyltransferase [Oceanimonas marisflavi]|uniref:FkbM family methyltransferase n=1 Tax=Oceanimonas marisflavi TaxID=2059724 RepID=UPI000D3124C9|nr:FkbM family methyltransferase [Oceanimonas marisflavi]